METLEVEETCGQELAASAVMPEQFGALFRHVAINLRQHAAWVGVATEDAAAEHTAMLAVAAAYEQIAAATVSAGSLMRSLESLKPVPHDPASMDRTTFVNWMQQKVELQRSLATLLLEHAEQSEHVLRSFGEESSI